MTPARWEVLLAAVLFALLALALVVTLPDDPTPPPPAWPQVVRTVDGHPTTVMPEDL